MPIVLVLALTAIFFIGMKGNRVLVILFAVDLLVVRDHADRWIGDECAARSR